MNIGVRVKRAFLFLIWLTGTAMGCTYSVGFYNLNSNGSQWEPTVAAMSAPGDSPTETCSFTLNSYTTQLGLLNAVKQAEIDLVLVNPGLMVCLTTQYDVGLIASLVNNLTGIETTVFGGDILVRQNSTIASIQDLDGHTAISGSPASTGLFQVQALAVLDAGLNVYENLNVLGFNSDQSEVMRQLLIGNFDAAFLRADWVDRVLESLSAPSDSVKIIDKFRSDVYPYPTTGDYLFPEWSMGSLPHVTQRVRTAAAESLFAIKSTDPGAVRQNYNSWTVPYNFFSHAQLQRRLGIMDESGACVITDEENFWDYVRCPMGTVKLTQQDVVDRCSVYKECINNITCVCTPCFRPINTLLFGLTSPVFWLVLVGVWLFIAVSGWTLQLTLLDDKIVIEVPMEHLMFPHSPEIIGESKYGNIVKATITTDAACAKPVAVHRLMPPTDHTTDRFFGPVQQVTHGKDMSRSDIWKKASEACRIQHPHILGAEGVVRNCREVWFVIEYPSAGNLYDLIHNQTLTIDMGTALRLLKEIAFALQCLHSEKPPITHRVSLYNIWLDSNRTALIMISDNFLPPSKSVMSDIRFFGCLMLQVLRQVSPATSIEPHSLQADLADPVLLIRDCTKPYPKSRPTIDEVIKRLMECAARWQIEQDKEASDKAAAFKQETDLLHSIFPKHVAEALRAGQVVQPEHHDCVSILFTDIVGFTSISSKLSPMKVADMLDRLYLQFDALSVQYDVFKLETVGDAYLAVSNLHKKYTDHSARIARFALHILDAARHTAIDTDLPTETLTIRVGINVGPVVASVAGNRNPRYCLFGNAINMASRMESTSTPGRIQLSETAAEYISEQALDLKQRICPRLDIQNVKGKGPTKTYWLTSDY